MSPWHAVLCKPRREALAEANLRRQGFEVYLPRMLGLRRRAGRWEETVEPLFPRYLFLNEGECGRGLAPVRSTPGVSDLVRSCGTPARVPPGVVEALRESADPATGCHRSGREPFAAGARVSRRAVAWGESQRQAGGGWDTAGAMGAFGRRGQWRDRGAWLSLLALLTTDGTLPNMPAWLGQSCYSTFGTSSTMAQWSRP